MSCTLTVTKINGERVELSGNLRIKFVMLNMISNGGYGVRPEDIKVGDKIKVEFDKTFAVTSAELYNPRASVIQYKKPPGGDQHPPPPVIGQHTPPPGGVQNLGPPPIQIRPDEAVISRPRPLNMLELPQDKLAALGSIFELHRKIASGPSNLALAILACIIDFSVTYAVPDMIQGMQALLTEYYIEKIPESTQDLQLLQYLQGMVIKSCTVNEKINEIQAYLFHYKADFDYLIRNCLQILIKLNYYKKEYEMFRVINNNNLEEVLNRVKNSMGTPSIEDFNFFLKHFDIQLTIIYTDSLSSYSIGGARHHINLIEANRSFHPIYTIEDSFLYSANLNDYLDSLVFVREVRTQRIKDYMEELITLQNNLEEINTKNNQIFKLFLSIANTIDPETNIESIHALAEEGMTVEEIGSIFENYCCNKCSFVREVVKYDCQHVFCKSCIQFNQGDRNLQCSLCGFHTAFDKIWAKISLIN